VPRTGVKPWCCSRNERTRKQVARFRLTRFFTDEVFYEVFCSDEVFCAESEHALARALGRAHSEYALALNQGQQRTGHVWQNRFFSCPMEERHLYTALRYVELNPVRAGMISVAWEWRWSSARAHVLDTGGDPVLDSQWKEYLGGWNGAEWKEMLARGGDEVESAVLRAPREPGSRLARRHLWHGWNGPQAGCCGSGSVGGRR